MNSYVVFDTETTGLDVHRCDIIELAGVKIIDGKVSGEYSTLIKTQQAIPPEITQVNHIDKELLEKEGQPPAKAFAEFIDFVDGNMLVAHFGLGFDYFMLISALKQHRLAIPRWPLIDTYILARKYLKTANNRFRLRDLCEAYHVKNDDAHRALSDTKALKVVVEHILRQESSLLRLWHDCSGFDLLALSQSPSGIKKLFRAMLFGLEAELVKLDGTRLWCLPQALVKGRNGGHWIMANRPSDNETSKLALDQVVQITDTRKAHTSKVA